MPLTAGQIVENCRLLSRLEPRPLKRLIDMAQRRSYEPRQTIFQQHDPCPGLFIVGRGQVRIYNLAPSGKEHILHFADPSSTFAEVAAIGGFPCPANAQAVEATTCALLPAAEFRRALRDDPEMSFGLLEGMARWVRHFVGLMEDIVLRDALSRVAHYLLDAAGGRAGEITLPAMKKDLASHLNLTSETLSRTLRRLYESGLVDQAGGSGIRINSIDGLSQVADGLFPET